MVFWKYKCHWSYYFYKFKNNEQKTNIKTVTNHWILGKLVFSHELSKRRSTWLQHSKNLGGGEEKKDRQNHRPCKGVQTSHWQESALKWIRERCFGESSGTQNGSFCAEEIVCIPFGVQSMGSAGGAEDWGSISLCKLTHRYSDYSVVLKKKNSFCSKEEKKFLLRGFKTIFNLQYNSTYYDYKIRI